MATKVKANVKSGKSLESLKKCATGISGLDEITGGGLPAGRTTLVCGAAGCGKSLMAMEFLVRGATEFGENGVLITFEEPVDDITKNVASLGFDITGLIQQKKLAVDYVRIERSEIEETGEYDLQALFIRLEHAIDSVRAKRVVLDTIESLFSGLTNSSILRAEIRRLFNFLKAKGVTSIVTGERGEGSLTRQGLEEYVSDCVILLDHRVIEQISTRRLRIVKYRGSTHGTNEYPFLIDENGISVLPITSLSLDHSAPSQRISTGIERLDNMLGGKGVYRGSSILISGTAGTGKTSIAAHFAAAACKRGERAMIFAFEESPEQIIRNMQSIGLDLEPFVKKDQLQIRAARPTLYGLEMHLVNMHKRVHEFKPTLVVVDPLTNLIMTGSALDTRSMIVRLVDYFKTQNITGVFTSLTSGGSPMEHTEVAVSSLVDTWLLVRDIEYQGERNRGLYILKSRGMAHSNQIREFRLTERGIDLVDVYLGEGEILTGSARLAQEARERAQAQVRAHDLQRKKRSLDRKKAALQARIAALQASYDSEAEAYSMAQEQEDARESEQGRERDVRARYRNADNSTPGKAKARYNGQGR